MRAPMWGPIFSSNSSTADIYGCFVDQSRFSEQLLQRFNTGRRIREGVLVLRAHAVAPLRPGLRSIVKTSMNLAIVDLQSYHPESAVKILRSPAADVANLFQAHGMSHWVVVPLDSKSSLLETVAGLLAPVPSVKPDQRSRAP